MKNNDPAFKKLRKVLIVLLVEVAVAFASALVVDSSGIGVLVLIGFFFIELLIICLIGGIVIYKIIRDSRKTKLVIALITTVISYPLILLLSTQIIANYLK